MKFLKFLEFNQSDIGKEHNHITYDFSPRRGTINIIKSNNISNCYFSEAYREVINYLENKNINKSLNSSNLLKDIKNYVNSITSDLVNSQQYGNITNYKLSPEQKIMINNIIKLPNTFWTEDSVYRQPILDFLENTFINIDVPSNILDLDKMIFYYDGFILNLLTKEWSPSKDINLHSLKDFNYYKTFEKYGFQKKYIESNPELLIKNIPTKLLNDKLRDEYEYVFKSNKFNL